MGSLTVVEKGADCQEVIEWPLFYMNDFSQLGLRVENLSRTLALLEASGYRVIRKSCGAKIEFEGRNRLRNIFHTLEQHRIAHTMSDLVGCAYQG